MSIENLREFCGGYLKRNSRRVERNS